MIYVTGDTHIPIDLGKLNMKNFPVQKGLREDDYLIICGDFGGVWDGGSEEKYWLKWLNSKNFTTLFVDGNHENFQALEENYQIEQFCGGKIHRIQSNIIHLMRGQVYALEGRRFFTMGGADSHDKEHRKEGKTWWAQEMPSQLEYQEAEDNLSKQNWDVDFVITHCAPETIQQHIGDDYSENDLTHFLEQIKNKLSYEKWFFGHYHVDKQVDFKHICLFNKILRIV